MEYYDNELYHYGVLGMKWGVRRYQNEDGTLTAAGRKRLYKDINTADKKNKPYDINVKYEKQLRKGIDEVKDSLRRGEPYEQYSKKGKDYAEKLLGKYANKHVGEWVNYDAKDWVNGAIWRMAKDELDAESRVRTPEQKNKLDSVYKKSSVEDKQLIDDFTKNTTHSDYGEYKSRLKLKIGDFDNVRVSVKTDEGSEKYSSIEAVSFLKKFDSDKAKEGLAKEYYDGPYSWIDKEPGEYNNYYTRDEFKNKLELESISIDPSTKTYVATYYDGDTYGGHFFVDEGSMKDMKVRYRSLEG